MTPEGKVKTEIKRVLKAYNVWYCMPRGTVFGRSGVPDFLCCVNGRFLAIEAKAGKNKTSALQEQEIQSINEHGGRAIIVSDEPGAMSMLIDVIGTLRHAD